MKKISSLLITMIVFALLVSACGGSGPATVSSKELNLYGWSEYIPPELLERFTKETGIKVNYDTYSSNEELIAKLQAGGGGYDVIIPSDYAVEAMTKQNLLEPLDLSQITNLKNIATNFKDLPYDPGNKFTVPYQWGTVGLVYNESKIKDKPSSWADLYKPEYAGKVVLLDDEREVLGLALMQLGLDRNTRAEADLNQAKAKILELKPSVKLFDSDSPKTALLSGEVIIGQTWNGEAALAHKENPAIQYLCPREGCGLWHDNLAIPKGAPHRDAALRFLNFVLEPRNSILISRDFPYSNPNQAALDLMKTEDPELYKSYMEFPATNPSVEDVTNAKGIRDVGEATPLWDRVWTEVKGGQ
jgi:spermidine/putrescine-binding protein